MKYLKVKIIDWFANLHPREQGVVSLLLILLSVPVAWGLLLKPLTRMRSIRVSEYQSAMDDLQWMREHAERAKHLPNALPSTPEAVVAVDANTLLGVVSETAATSAITIARAEPSENAQLQVIIERVSFNRLLGWLEALDREHKIIVEQIAIDKIAESPGHVSVRMALSQRAPAS